MDRRPITRGGFQRLFWRLEYLRRNARREVAEDLAAAREYGLTKRNLEWRTAREKQSWVEFRIHELEKQINSCEVVVKVRLASAPERAEFGMIVTVRCCDDDHLETWRLVGPFESDASQGLLSIESPAGKAILNRGRGEWVNFVSPTGLRTLRIVDIRRPPEEFTPALLESRPPEAEVEVLESLDES